MANFQALTVLESKDTQIPVGTWYLNSAKMKGVEVSGTDTEMYYAKKDKDRRDSARYLKVDEVITNVDLTHSKGKVVSIPITKIGNKTVSKTLIVLVDDISRFQADPSDATDTILYIEQGAFKELKYTSSDSPATILAAVNELSIIKISNGTVAADNTYIDVVLSSAGYGADDGSTALALADFTVTFAQSGGTATAWTAATATQVGGGALAGGETTVRINGAVTGTADGNETVTVTPADGTSVFNSFGTPMVSTETTGALNLNV